MATEELDYEDIGPTIADSSLEAFVSAGVHPAPPIAPRPLAVAPLPLSSPSIVDEEAPAVSSTQPVRRPPCVGDLLDGLWRLEEILGSGGSAYVYAASHIDGRRAAVKVLREELAHDQMTVARFLGDGRIANLVRHPGVVIPLHDGVTDAGIPFLVVERLDGQTLEERIAQRGPLSLIEATQMTKALLDVLAATHEKAIIHRDVKPENVFLTNSGRLKLIDFGIARPPLQMAATRTLEQTVIGTPAFMSPEQARGRWAEIDARSDLWAVGATFFRAVTGRYLRTCATAMEDLIEATEPLDPMIEIAPKLPSPLRDWLDRALAFDRKDRFATAKEMSEALDRALWSPESTPYPFPDEDTDDFIDPPTTKLPPKSKPRIPLWALAAIALTISLGLLVPLAILAPHSSTHALQPSQSPTAAAATKPAPTTSPTPSNTPAP